MGKIKVEFERPYLFFPNNPREHNHQYDTAVNVHPGQDELSLVMLEQRAKLIHAKIKGLTTPDTPEHPKAPEKTNIIQKVRQNLQPWLFWVGVNAKAIANSLTSTRVIINYENNPLRPGDTAGQEDVPANRRDLPTASGRLRSGV